jgi:lysophospholipase L1-like esterase
MSLSLGIAMALGSGGYVPPPAFDPSDLPSLVHRLRGEGQTAGSLTTWTALVGASETGGVAPTAVAGVANGKTAVRFVAASSQYLTETASTYLSGASACTVAIMFRPSAAGNSVWFERGAGGLRVQTYTSRFYFTPAAGGSYFNTGILLDGVVPQSLILTYDGATVTCYVDGVAKSLTPSGAVPATLGTFATGTKVGGTPVGPAYGDGDIYDVMVFSEAYDATTVGQLADYMRDTYLPHIVVCAGDSLTYGAPTGPSISYPTVLRATAAQIAEGWDTKQVATSGWTIADVAGAMSTILAYGDNHRGKKAVVLSVGTNDVGTAGTAVATALAAYEAVADTAIAAGFQVVGCTLINRDDVYLHAGVDFPAVKVAWAAGLEDMKVRGKLAAIAYIGEVTELLDPHDGTYFQSDFLHLQAAGYAKMAPPVRTALATLLPRGNNNATDRHPAPLHRLPPLPRRDRRARPRRS